MYTYTIFKDNKEVAKYTNQDTDIKVFAYLHKEQSQSIDWAIKHGGYRVEVTNETTGETTQY